MDESSKIDLIRAALPAVNKYAYLNTGTYGPAPRACYDAIRAWQDEEFNVGRIAPGRAAKTGAVKNEARAALARLIGAQPESIALTRNTTEGMNIAVFGYRWQPGDEIVTSNIEHGGGLLPIRLAEKRFGVTVRIADLKQASGDISPRVAPLLTDRTRLVALSNVSWSTGALFDMKPLIALCHARGIAVAIDGAQSAAAIPMNVVDLDVDYYAFPGQKWLMGPSGTGGFYARADRLAELDPPWIGTGAISNNNDPDNFALWPDGRRFEGASTSNLAALAGLAASLIWFLDDVGADWALARNAALADHAIAGLNAVEGVEVVTPSIHAPLVCFRVAGQSPADVVTSLAKDGVVTRSVNDTGVVRLSTGFYNTEQEIDRAIELVRALVRHPVIA